MYEYINLTKKNLLNFVELNNSRNEFNSLNEDFMENYEKSSFAKQIFLRKKVKILRKDLKDIGYIWITMQDRECLKINSINVMKNEDLFTCYSKLINSIGKKNKLIYSCEKNNYNFELLNALGFQRKNGIIELSLNLEGLNQFALSGLEMEKGLEMENIVKGKKEEIRCKIQNEIFKSATRVPLSVEDIYFDEFQEYYYDKGAILVKKDNKYIGYGQIIIENKKPFIVNFGIIQEYRNKGYGKKLLMYLLLTLKENHFKNVKIRVYADNKSALNLYISLGFKIESECSDWELYVDSRKA